MEKGSPPIVKKSLFSWIISKNTWLQVVLVITGDAKTHHKRRD
jgi:hypothetical protein